MPQEKAGWHGPPIEPWLHKMVQDCEDDPTARPHGPLPLDGHVSIPEDLLSDNRLPPHAIRIYGAMLGFARQSKTTGVWTVRVHDRYLVVITGLQKHVVKYSREKLEEYGYLERAEGSMTPGEWYGGYRGHWAGHNEPPTYVITELEGRRKEPST